MVIYFVLFCTSSLYFFLKLASEKPKSTKLYFWIALESLLAHNTAHNIQREEKSVTSSTYTKLSEVEVSISVNFCAAAGLIPMPIAHDRVPVMYRCIIFVEYSCIVVSVS